MFYAATAILAQQGKRIKSTQGIHRLTYHALVHYFLNQENKLLHELTEYNAALEEAEERLQLDTLISDLDSELKKRGRYTYKEGEEAARKKAETSFQRARRFYKEVEKLMS